MNVLVVLTGMSACFWVLVMFTAVASATDTDVIIFMLVIEVVLVWLFLICLKKYRSPEYKAKQQKAREEWAAYKAAAPERERLRLRETECRRRTKTVVSTRLIGEGAAVYKKSVGDMVVRGTVGSLFGPVGTVVGMATAKTKNVNKDKRRFLVKYEDGHVEEKEVTVGDVLYKQYMQCLEYDLE